MYTSTCSHVIIIEIDENGHQYYGTTCETIRLQELYEDFGFRPLVFIRFNPDGYVDKHGVQIKSCFTICKTTGIQIVDKTKKTEWNLRLERLRDIVQKWVKNTPEDNVFEYLY